MRKEVFMQKARHTLACEAAALLAVRKVLGPEFARATTVLAAIRGKVVVSGIGKSGQIGRKIASTLTSLGIEAAFLSPAEAMHGDLGLITESDAVLAISYSGETKELLRMLSHIKHLKVPVVSITGRATSSLARMSVAALAFSIKSEGSPYNLAPMASTTASLVVGDCLATALCVKRGLTQKHFARAHPGGALGLQLTPVREFVHRTLPRVTKNEMLPQVLKVMNRGKMGLATVVEGAQLVGVITDGDVRRYLSSGKSLERVTATNVMTKKPKTIAPDASLKEALATMERYKITSLFVTNKAGHLRGIVRMHDIVERGIL